MRQIREKGYADKYAAATLVSIAADVSARRVGAWLAERVG
jgi:hypothetical protein